MKKRNSYRFIILLVLIFAIFPSCDKWVKDVDPLISSIEGKDLLSEHQLDIQLVGLLAQFGRNNEFDGWTFAVFRVGIFSDELTQDKRIPGAGAPDFAAFVQDTQFDIDFTEGDWLNIQELRWLADRLVKQVEDIEAGPGITNDELKEECLWWGNVIGGLMRMILAENFCLTKTGGPGAVVTTIEQFENGEYGSFETMAELHAHARALLNEALSYDPGETPGVESGTADKIVHSLIARTYLFDGSYALAATEAALGLEEGDAPFQIVCDYQYFNGFWSQGRGYGYGYDVFRAHPRFTQYVVDDRDEGEILTALKDASEDPFNLTLSLRGYEGNNGQPGNRYTEDPRAGFGFERLPLFELGIDEEDGAYNEVVYLCDLYPNRTGYANIIDWREMELILAEVAIRNSDVPTAVTHVNNVRNAHGLTPFVEADFTNYDNIMGGANDEYWPPLLRRPHVVGTPTKIDGPLGLLIQERDKTLWLKGTRLMDQYRFGLWHLETGTWQFIPVPLSERIMNPNIALDQN